MAFGIILQDEQGRRSIERLADRDGGVSRLISKSEEGLLGLIDPYGDTIFNRLQAGVLLKEWMSLETSATTEVERQLCFAVRQLIERVAHEPHLYLKLVGD
jgi:hypothetical protein